MPRAGGIGARTLVIGIAVVLAAQGLTIFAVYRMTAGREVASAARAPVAQPGRQAEGSAPRFVAEPRRSSGATSDAQSGAPIEPPPVRPVVKRAPPLTRWSDRPLDDMGQHLAEEVGCPADDLRLLADERGRVTDGARRDLLAGREAASKVAQELGLAGDGEERLAQIMVGFMLRRVTMRAAFQGTSMTPGAIDDAVRADALAAAQGNLDARAKDAVASKLAGLPDLTADMPTASH